MNNGTGIFVISEIKILFVGILYYSQTIRNIWREIQSALPCKEAYHKIFVLDKSDKDWLLKSQIFLFR